MYVYISGPYSNGDQALNARTAIEAADAVMCAGHVPFCPHLAHFWHMLFPHDYEEWMWYDLAWLEQCDAVIRLTGESPGADREVARAHESGLPVYYGVEAFLRGEVSYGPFAVLVGGADDDDVRFTPDFAIED